MVVSIYNVTTLFRAIILSFYVGRSNLLTIISRGKCIVGKIYDNAIRISTLISKNTQDYSRKSFETLVD